LHSDGRRRPRRPVSATQRGPRAHDRRHNQPTQCQAPRPFRVRHLRHCETAAGL